MPSAIRKLAQIIIENHQNYNCSKVEVKLEVADPTGAVDREQGAASGSGSRRKCQKQELIIVVFIVIAGLEVGKPELESNFFGGDDF